MAQNYRPQLDGIRAFCIIFTIVNHVPGKPDYIDGTVGVDVFFALSGWLITWLLLEERRSAGAIDLKAFYIRRFFRIVPLYYFTIVVYAAAAVLFFLATASSAKIQELLEAIAYLLTFNSEYRSSEAGTVFGHAWTLGIEEKFYVVWPALIVIFRKWVFGSVVCAAVSVSILIAAFGYNDFLARGYFGLGFGAGVALLVDRSPRSLKWLHDRSLAGAALCSMAGMYVGLILMPNVLWSLGIAASAAIMIGSLWFRQGQILSRFLSSGPLPWLGTLTYAIYLFQSLAINVGQVIVNRVHAPQNFVLVFIASYCVAVLVAWIVHALVERPCIAYGRKLVRLARTPPRLEVA